LRKNLDTARKEQLRLLTELAALSVEIERYDDAVRALLVEILPRDENDSSDIDLDAVRAAAAALNAIRAELKWLAQPSDTK
jgi:hypothetical protein